MLDNVPLNTDRIFVMGKTKNGCEVYVPIKSTDDPTKKKNELQKELNIRK